MIYNNKYKVFYYCNGRNKRAPVFEYIKKLSSKDRAKVFKYIDFLRDNKGVLDEPYSKHIKDKIRELRVDFSRNRHRVFYVVVIEKRIILLSAFFKKTSKTPKQEIIRALNNFEDYKVNKSLIEYEK
ncbi:type II toxin-antitoxin system RelE/ParE family toxin [Patescibacteria group bacterium]|nr:type II toxin-antitoxin system RelE/ParE family toxin [Patescibacteria group bacterium]MBU2579848.1 type II toxin-antitoxin system RelE/ParE family toxin [Patescibacteria group bacterium]MBU4030713.1 type II toxin-antitoxin system RelE/ParE family toxin [Patescibacteria group bacterium]MBU4082348.1 type II toxin-antitoxin system RelE/ParE family toxin [Patescibacteria group bacterium]MCG2809766.1 type II toxin-antitoxin system RelE/ParE family toxin [Candidatus Portnoybacteria bacterium]